MSKKPFLSTGSIVEDYSLLLKYVEICKRKNVDCSVLIPSSHILSELRNEIERSSKTFNSLIEFVESKLGDKIDCEISLEAFIEVYAVRGECNEAKRIILTQLTGWYIEILESLGYVKIKYSWKP